MFLDLVSSLLTLLLFSPKCKIQLGLPVFYMLLGTTISFVAVRDISNTPMITTIVEAAYLSAMNMSLLQSSCKELVTGK